MFAALATMPLPELAALLLVAGIPLALGKLAAPLLRARRTAPPSRPSTVDSDTGIVRPLGLSGQWSSRARQLEEGFERQRAALRLHRAAGNRLGALDHEIDRLRRDTRSIMASASSSA